MADSRDNRAGGRPSSDGGRRDSSGDEPYIPDNSDNPYLHPSANSSAERAAAREAARSGSSGGSRGSSRSLSSSSGSSGSRSSSRGSGSPGGGRGRSKRPKTDILHSDTAHELVSRHTVLMGGFSLLAVLGVARLADYQIVNRDTYVEEADSRRLLSETLYAKRGTIYDRNGNVLASSVECQNVYLNPQLIEAGTEGEVADALVEVLGIDQDEADELVMEDTTFVYVQRQVDQDVADELEGYGYAGIGFEQSMKRVYPYGNLASQVLGVVNVDNEGLTGLELQYDDVLTGTNGSIVRERASDGSYIAGGAYEKVPAEDGTDIVLTLDATIQQAAEDAIAEAVEDVEANYGSIIVTDPTTGEILAACSYPTYDQTDLSSAETEDMNLRVVTDSYEPGSVFKTFVCGAAIDMGLVTPDTYFHVPVSIEVGDDVVSDSDDRDYAMDMTVREILRRSSNVGMVMVGREIGADSFAEYVDAYGFGQDSGIDFPGESAGIVKDRDEYDGASLGSMSFGQSIAVPPTQMVRAMSGIANGGVMTTPHFLKAEGAEEVDWSDGDTQVISAEAAGDVADMMLTVVEEGTGTEAQIEGYEVSGKTGTAQRAEEGESGYVENSYMASFMGFVSTTDPRALCYVTLDGTTYSSHDACPPFVSVMETAIDVLDIPPTSSGGSSDSDSDE